MIMVDWYMKTSLIQYSNASKDSFFNLNLTVKYFKLNNIFRAIDWTHKYLCMNVLVIFSLFCDVKIEKNSSIHFSTKNIE